MDAQYLSDEYVLAMAGLALLRAWGTDAGKVHARAREIAAISQQMAGEQDAAPMRIREYGPAEGYALWAETYDSAPNLLFRLEEGAVHPILEARPAGRALDAACGTGRHAAWLAANGHTVTGVDASPQMLAMARQRVPEGCFVAADLVRLNLPAESFDLITCSLALTHLPALGPPITEMARVLAPGGRMVLSDVHPTCTALGLHGFFRSATGARGCVRNLYHPISAYLAAFQRAGLEIVQCVEVPWDLQAIASMGLYPRAPEALEGALENLPFVLVWELALLGTRLAFLDRC